MRILNRVQLIVEGDFDKRIASSFLKAAGIPMERVEFLVANGARNIKKMLKEFKGLPVAVLMDLDESSNYQSNIRLKEKYNLRGENLSVFAAIPTIEAWLFADIEAARKKSANKKRSKELLDRIPMPDEIPYPKHLAVNLFNLNEKFELVEDDIDIKIAMARSPSLRNFISGIANLLGHDLGFNWESDFVRSSGRDIFSKIVSEVIPSDKVIYKTLNGQVITAEEMSRHIQEGSDTGLRYSVEL